MRPSGYRLSLYPAEQKSFQVISEADGLTYSFVGLELI